MVTNYRHAKWDQNIFEAHEFFEKIYNHSLLKFVQYQTQAKIVLLPQFLFRGPWNIWSSNLRRLKANVSQENWVMPCPKTILNCFAVEHSEFKTKHLNPKTQFFFRYSCFKWLSLYCYYRDIVLPGYLPMSLSWSMNYHFCPKSNEISLM